MQQQWIGHAIETDEGPLMCLIDIGLGEVCPDRSRPACTLVRIPFADPGEDGFGGQDERDRIGGFEDAIEAAIAKDGAVHFASVRGMGVLDAWFYSSQRAAAGIEAAARRACAGYEIEVGSNPDPEWEQYQMLFPDEEAIGQYHDAQLIAVLEENGDRVDEARPVDHALYLPTQDAADAAARAAEAEGFQVTECGESEEGDEEFPFLLQLTKEHAVDMDTITRVRELLSTLAAEHEGSYDGWQAPLVK